MQIRIPNAPDIETIKEFKRKGFIDDKSPFWWGTDYAPDPREYLTFKEFRNRLVHLGDVSTTYGQ